MREDGFSLMELITVMAVAGILTAIATLQFSSYSRKAGIESQTRSIYSELMNARQQSMFRKSPYRVTLASNEIRIFSSGDVSVPPVVQLSLKYPLKWNGFAGNMINFDTRGCLQDVSSDGSICADLDDNPGAYDSIVISWTRTSLGKRQTGGECKSGHIVLN
jgi:prepilin-type N-terminal cleavage/methylation domain-containing protein